MRTASISIGIVEYSDRHYRESAMRLRHASDDARAFSRYVTLAGDETEDRDRLHHALFDNNATWERLSQAAAEIASQDVADLFILYLSGHGEPGNGSGGWFCLVDAKPGLSSLTPAQIDDLLAQITANHIVVVVDCCYAEAITAHLKFGFILRGMLSRFLIASARGDQKSWEDDQLARSIFSDVLLRALSTDSLVADANGYVDVEAALLPHLREQVPLVASSRKRGAVQEPVTAAIAAASLKLPTVESRSLGRSLTTSEAVRAGVRRIAIGAVVAALTLLAGLELFVYHLAVGPTGAIVVRPGLTSTFGLQPLHLRATIDTGLTLAQVDQQKGVFIRDLADGSAWGFTTHLDADGIRTWLGLIEPGLSKQDRVAIGSLARGQIEAFSVDDDPPPLIEVSFLSKAAGLPAASLGERIYPNRRYVDVGCDANAAQRLDFSLLQSSPSVYRFDALWAAATLPNDPAPRAERLLALVKLAAYRAHHGKREEAVAEFAAFAAAVGQIVKSSKNIVGFRAEAERLLETADGSWCSLHADFALGAVQGQDRKPQRDARLWATFESFDRSVQGDVPTKQQALAAEALGTLASFGPLSTTKIAAIVERIQGNGTELSALLPDQRLLARIAQSQHLPASVITFLISKLGPPVREFDFDPLLAIRILSCNALHLDEKQREPVRAWLRSKASENATMTDVQEALGCAALAWPLEEQQLNVLISRLSPASRFPPRESNYRGETVIQSNGDAATVALGRVAQRHSLDPGVVRQLANLAASRSDLPDRGEIVRGLASQRYANASEPAEAIFRRLAEQVSDAAQRKLEMEVAASFLSAMAEARKQQTTTRLLQKWREEREPELRIALAHVLGLIVPN
jgi:hypothetical protein